MIEAVVPPEPAPFPRPIDITVKAEAAQPGAGLIVTEVRQGDGSWLRDERIGVVAPGDQGVHVHPNPDYRVFIEAPDCPAGSKGVEVSVFIENTQTFRCIVWQHRLQKDGGWKRSKLATANPEDEDMLFYADEQTRIEAEHQDI
jgi:hypothetical protein